MKKIIINPTVVRAFRMNRYRHHLLSAFGSILGVASLTGCSDLRQDFTETVCEDGEVSLVKKLQPAEPVDYIALRSVGASVGSTPTVLQSEGTCPTSANCSELEVAPEASGMRGGFAGDSLHLAYVRDDTVELLMTADEVRAFLGTIDTPSEAALMAYLNGYNLDCDGPNLNQATGGYLIYGQTGNTCGGDIKGHKIFVSEDGTIEVRESDIAVHGDEDCAIGRLPAGLASRSKSNGDSVGAFFAEVSHLEAASVAAFEDLAAELEHHGAPAELIAWAHEAAREEIRHAIVTGALARRYGGARRIPQVTRQAPRDLEAIAIDNAAEGLGRETFGALIGHHQALHAGDDVIRHAMQTIADDETSHAEFSQALHEWLSSKLSPDARLRVSKAREDALAKFRTTLCREPHPEVRRLAGLPSAATAVRMFDQLFGPRDIPVA